MESTNLVKLSQRDGRSFMAARVLKVAPADLNDPLIRRLMPAHLIVYLPGPRETD